MGIHRWPLDSLTKGPVTRKMMTSSWQIIEYYDFNVLICRVLHNKFLPITTATTKTFIREKSAMVPFRCADLCLSRQASHKEGRLVCGIYDCYPLYVMWSVKAKIMDRSMLVFPRLNVSSLEEWRAKCLSRFFIKNVCQFSLNLVYVQTESFAILNDVYIPNLHHIPFRDVT